MERVVLGKSGISVSPLCIGGMSFGEPSKDFHQWTIGPEETREVIRRALELGVNFIDTANVYAHGTSEEFIGAALRDLGVRREDVVVASKVFFNEGASSAKAIKREIEGTLRRLNTDYLDLYILHRFDYGTPVEETMGALNELVEAGTVRALGASEMYGYQYHNLQIVAERNGWAPLSTLQCHHNLLYREGERELIPVARQYGALPTPYSPLASGHLVRPNWEGNSRRAETDEVIRNKYDAAREKDQPIVDRVAEVAQRLGVPMARVALAWQWAHGPAAPLVGCSKPSRVDEAVAAWELKLSAEDVAYLEEPYTAHELVGPLARPGEKELAGTTRTPGSERSS